MGYTEWVAYLAAILALASVVHSWIRKPSGVATPSDNLSSAQRWEVAKIIGAVVVGFGAILGLGGAFLIQQSAAAIKASQVATELSNRSSFLQSVANLSVPLPQGAVAAFDLESCPDGWSDFVKAQRRMILGAVKGSDRPRGMQGGEEMHILTVSEIPSHQHSRGTLRMEPDGRHVHRSRNESGPNGLGAIEQGGDGGGETPVGMLSAGLHLHRLTGEMGAIGGGKPHNNMPPYIALYFCKKD